MPQDYFGNRFTDERDERSTIGEISLDLRTFTPRTTERIVKAGAISGAYTVEDLTLDRGYWVDLGVLPLGLLWRMYIEARKIVHDYGYVSTQGGRDTRWIASSTMDNLMPELFLRVGDITPSVRYDGWYGEIYKSFSGRHLREVIYSSNENFAERVVPAIAASI